MPKKHNPNPHERPKLVAIERKARETASSSSPSRLAYLRASSVSQDQREARARREALDLLMAEKKAPTVGEDLQAVRRRPLDAPMASWSDDVDVREREAWADKTNHALDDVVPPLGIGRAILTLLLMAIGFVAGFVIGRW